MAKFKVGDRVRYKGTTKSLNGICGTVICDKYPYYPNYVGVEFDAKLDFLHTCSERGKMNRCWWCFEEHLNPVGNRRSPKRHIIIEITDDGAEAKYIDGKDVKKTASVRRHPDDEPNDYHAARYVLGKMFGKIQLAEKHEKDISEALGWLTGSVQTMEKAREKLIEIVKETKGGGK